MSTRSESQAIPGWVAGTLVIGVFAALVWAEHRRPLRTERESKTARNTRNLAIAGLSAATLSLLEKPILGPLSRLVAERRIGLLPLLNLPKWLEAPAAVLLMDYTLYWWHVLRHRAPLLWRFHAVHHVDLDMDASTALRFHFGEMAMSVPYRAAQVAVIGVPPRALSIWQALLFLSIMFHHSNVRLPARIERWLVWFVVTPRMHEIHHSIIKEETNSNWSSGCTLWDRLHGTLRLDLPERAIDIGVPAYRDANELGLTRLVEMPFRKQRPSWECTDGSRPKRVMRARRLGAFRRTDPERYRITRTR
jgi:sterol desaturase/sphingolipid hydroxylase (fatty acid hydroxylase superfamily)